MSDDGFYPDSDDDSDLTDQPLMTSYPYPMDSGVQDALETTDELDELIEETLDDVASDPTGGGIAAGPVLDIPAIHPDSTAASVNPVVGDLAPVLGDVGTMGGIIGGVLDDPDAPLTSGETEFVETEIRQGEYWNPIFGGIQSGLDVQYEGLEGISELYEGEAVHNRTYEVLWEIHRQLNEDIAGPKSSEGLPVPQVWWDVNSGYEQPWPWPSY